MKNTRLIYTDKEHIEMCKAMPAEQFKEYMLAIMEYRYGDDSVVESIKDPMVKALFISEKSRIDFNEKKWADRAKVSRENGKSGGRPKKKEEPEVSVYTEEETESDKSSIIDNIVKHLKTIHNECTDEDDYERRLNNLCSTYGVDKSVVAERFKTICV